MLMTITFRGMESTAALTQYAEKRAAKLERFSDRLVSCRVTLESEGRHKSHGRTYRVRIDLTLPGAELVVGDHTRNDGAHQDAYSAIDIAFDEAGRMVRDFVGRRRQSKPPAVAS